MVAAPDDTGSDSPESVNFRTTGYLDAFLPICTLDL